MENTQSQTIKDLGLKIDALNLLTRCKDQMAHMEVMYDGREKRLETTTEIFKHIDKTITEIRESLNFQ